jgi:voltage-gated sodium channel
MFVTAWLRSLVIDPRTERAIMVLIMINAVVLGLETNAAVTAAYGPLLRLLDQAILAVFVIEIAARIVVHRASFFRDPWGVFDFIVVGIALVPATETFSVLRALRVLRILRLITTVPSLKRVVGGLITALPGMGSVVVLLSLLFYVFSVMATNLFGPAFPDWFGSIGASAYSLFQIMTLESWSMGIVRPVMEVYPYAWAFFVPYIVVTTFAVLNLFIGIVVNAMQSEHERAVAEERAAERDMIHDETAPLVEEIRALRAEINALRERIESPVREPTG